MFGKSPPPVALAHFMLGNTYSYADALWLHQFEQATGAGLDGFVLNLGPEEWQWTQALTAARLCPPNFRLCLSLDMNVLPPTPTLLVDRVLAFARAKCGRHQLRRDGRAVLSTFGGGGLELEGGGWKGVKKRLKEVGEPVYFVPAFFLPPQTILDDPAIDAAFAWNGAWEIHGAGSGCAEERELVDSRKPYMSAVSPCFFTHYGTKPPFAFNKNWIYGTDNAWYARRWEQVLVAKRLPALVQVLSWNDFGEAHYIGPLEGSQPGSEAWTESMPHDALLALTAHYIRRLKSAHPSRPLGPAQTGAEHLVLWYRPHSADLRTVGSDAVGRPANTAWAADTISYFAHLAEPATLVVCATGRDGAAVQRSIDLPAGEYASALPFAPGLQSFRLVRRGRVVAALEGREILAEGECAAWNFNLWSGQVRF